MKKRNKMLLITSMVLAACGSLCLGRSLTTLPGKECPQTEQVEEEPWKQRTLHYEDGWNLKHKRRRNHLYRTGQMMPVPKTGDSFWW